MAKSTNPLSQILVQLREAGKGAAEAGEDRDDLTIDNLNPANSFALKNIWKGFYGRRIEFILN